LKIIKYDKNFSKSNFSVICSSPNIVMKLVRINFETP
jgi:hypothetical protein